MIWSSLVIKFLEKIISQLRAEPAEMHLMASQQNWAES